MRSTASLLIVKSLVLCTVLNSTYGGPILGIYRNANPGEFSFAVSIGEKSGNEVSPLEDLEFCTGTLITAKHVLTAEHCLEDETLDSVEVIIGAVDLNNGEKYSLSSWITYHKWKFRMKSENFDHDIAILTLNRNVDTSVIKPAKLLLSAPFTLADADLKIAGWGQQENGRKSSVMKIANLKLLPRDKCETRIETLIGDSFKLHRQDMCSRASPFVLTACGDSGGPLLDKKNYLVGINVAKSPTCTRRNDVGVSLLNKQINLHLSIYYYREFIKNVTKGELKFV